MGKDEWVGVNGGREVRTGGSRGGKVWEKVVNMRSKFCIERKKGNWKQKSGAELHLCLNRRSTFAALTAEKLYIDMTKVHTSVQVYDKNPIKQHH